MTDWNGNCMTEYSCNYPNPGEATKAALEQRFGSTGFTPGRVSRG